MDIDLVRGVVTRYFRTYGERAEDHAITFACDISQDVVDLYFSRLKEALAGEEYIPFLRKQEGEYMLTVVERPKVPRKKRKPWVNLVLLIATVFTTALAGAFNWVGFAQVGLPSISAILTPRYLLYGALTFGLPLMAILGIHESGHYIAARRLGVDASPPFFIPIPPLPPFALGTLGAVISMRGVIPSKKALIRVGAAGPIFGFLVAIPVCIAGLVLTKTSNVVIPAGAPVLFLNNPPLLLLFEWIIGMPPDVVGHPMLFAGWVGLFATALNLLPVGQLDGGHVVRALLGGRYERLIYAVVLVVALLLALMGGGNWLFVIILITILGGTRHPPPLDDVTPLGPAEKLIGVACVVMFLLCFAPILVTTG